MKTINWKLRFKNKATLTAIIMACMGLGYQVCGILGVIPSISESQLIELMGMIINLLVLLGIVVDPTTKGITDSEQALTYQQPKEGK